MISDARRLHDAMWYRASGAMGFYDAVKDWDMIIMTEKNALFVHYSYICAC